MIFNPGKTSIRTLRIRSSAQDPLLLKSRLARSLSQADLHPRNLEAHAILIIRSAHCAKPYSGWESAIAKEIEELARGAARPGRGESAVGANAVVFGDVSELLAALGCDATAGVVSTRWWWRAIAPATGLDMLLLERWLDEPRYIPAAVSLLFKTGDATAFARSRNELEMQALIGATARVAGGRRLEAVMEGIETGRMTGCAADLHHAPWRAWAPGLANTMLPAVREAWIGLAVTAHAAPHVARSLEFAESMDKWLRGEANAEEAINDSNAAPRHESTPGRRPQSVEDQRSVRQSRETEFTKMDAKWFDESVAARGFDSASDERIANKPEAIKEELLIIDPVEEVRDVLMPKQIQAQKVQVCGSDALIVTEWGGVFYLLNVAIKLNLYPDFSSPRDTGLKMPIWDFLALAAEWLAGPAVRSDPIWAFLSDMAGRSEGDSPGGEKVNEPDRGWFEWVMRYKQARLAMAMGVAQEEVAELLFRQSAKIRMKGPHLDVFFSLNDLPIEIRRAGLDRNPGWIPAAARFVAFHYD